MCNKCYTIVIQLHNNSQKNPAKKKLMINQKSEMITKAD